MKIVSYEQALHRLAAYCSCAERCSFDLRKKMADWELSGSDCNKIIEKLQKENFLSDERFCMAFVRDKFRYNKWGVHKIRYELKKKQLPENLIDSALQEIDNQSNTEQLRLLLAHKHKSVKGANDYEINQKLIRFAIGRGFDLEDILRVLPEFQTTPF